MTKRCQVNVIEPNKAFIVMNMQPIIILKSSSIFRILNKVRFNRHQSSQSYCFFKKITLAYKTVLIKLRLKI